MMRFLLPSVGKQDDVGSLFWEDKDVADRAGRLPEYAWEQSFSGYCLSQPDRSEIMNFKQIERQFHRELIKISFI